MRRILEPDEANAAIGDDMSVGYLEATGEMLSQVMVGECGRKTRHKHSGALHDGHKPNTVETVKTEERRTQWKERAAKVIFFLPHKAVRKHVGQCGSAGQLL
jgi:hypothetical protein